MSRLEQLKAMMADDPDDSFILFAIAKEYEKNGDIKSAINQFELLYKKDPSYIGLYYHLAHLYALNEQADNAFMMYDKGIELAKSSSDFHALSELVNARKNLEIEL